MELEKYFEFSGDEAVRITGTRVNIETVLRDYLEAGLRERTPLHRFLTGGVTFCRMMPLRSIPFRVVCLIGMNDRDYPRRERLQYRSYASAPDRRNVTVLRRLSARCG